MDASLQHPGFDSKGTRSSRGASIELKSILAPIDFSPASQRGLAFAAAVATHFGSQLHVVYDVEPPSLPQWGYAHIPIREARLRRTAEERLPQFVTESGVDVTLVHSTAVRNGGAEFEICEAALEKDADLIVMASHGLGGVKHAFIGSTAERVVRHAPCPVLTVRERAFANAKRAQPLFAPRRILMATDFSEASKKAFPYAIALGRKFEATLVLVHVVPSHLPAQFSHIGLVLEEQRMLMAARKQLPLLRAAAFDPNLPVETLVLHGGAANEICTAAKEQRSDLVVISTHGYSGVKRFALGSVTENVVRHAPCPVLVVREREREFVNS